MMKAPRTIPVALLCSLLLVLAACATQSLPPTQETSTPEAATEQITPEVATAEPTPAATTEAEPTDAPTTEAATFSDDWESVACDTFSLSAEIAAQSDCGYVTVPELHSQPDGPSIQVAVVRTRSSSANPAPDPLFMENGGPGSPTIKTFAVDALPALPNLQNILAVRDLVFVDQRGTFNSRPNLICTEQIDHDIQVAKDLVAEDDLSWWIACRDRLLAEEVNLDAFNTVENAADMYAVAEALGYDQFNYYGVSYGTLLGQYVLAQAEEHTAQLRSVIIDGVVMPFMDFNAAGSHTLSYALRNFFAACAQDAACNQAFPDLETVFLSLVDQLNQQPVPVTMTVKDATEQPIETFETTLDGQDLVMAVFQILYDASKTRALPRQIYQSAQNNDFSWVADTLAPEYKSAPDAHGMYVPVLCARVDSVQTEAASLFDPPYEQVSFLGTQEGGKNSRECELISVEHESPFVYDNTDIPTLILNGSHDPATPQPYGEYISSQLATAYMYTFPDSGHGSIFFHPCPGQIGLDFLADPAQAPDSSCISSMQTTFEIEQAAE